MSTRIYWIGAIAIAAVPLSGCDFGLGMNPASLAPFGEKSSVVSSTAALPPPPTPSSSGEKKKKDWDGIPYKSGSSSIASQKGRPKKDEGHSLPLKPGSKLPAHSLAPSWRGSGSELPAHDPDSIELGLRYVSYRDGQGADVESHEDALADVEDANEIWRRCGIQFHLDDYAEVDPAEYQLRYRTRSYNELDEIREDFQDPAELLVVATGRWDRTGSLGNSWANAWTSLPGDGVYGVVLENSVSRYPQILAHELGHYLSLAHVDDPTSLMNPVVHPNSLEMSDQECEAARWAARTYWRKMFR